MSTPAEPAAPVVIDRVDHLVLTVVDIEQAIDFYVRVLGMEPVTFGAGRRALRFGRNKLNLHQAGHEFDPKARRPTPGSTDVCLVTTTPLDRVVAHLRACGVPIEEGPVSRIGATGPITSVYLRDPDGDLVEVSTYDAEALRADER
jgi:catechol 2,3-dioxygenase-like lactoylglutathione lyase family enzyme